MRTVQCSVANKAGQDVFVDSWILVVDGWVGALCDEWLAPSWQLIRVRRIAP